MNACRKPMPRGEGRLDVGDKVKMRLISVEVEKGFIDFEKVN